MSAEEWSRYFTLLKEGFLKCNEYLQEKFSLLEGASSALKNSFSIEKILLFCLNENELQDLNYLQRKDLMKDLFEIYFNYSKNLLIHFDIYSEKSITDTTPLMVDYLSKFPKFSDHLVLMGYVYRSGSGEWKYSESRLTNDKRKILQFITVCCCIGYSYLDQPSKFLKLSIFQDRRESLQNFIDTRTCEYCNYAFNKYDLCCSVCSQEIGKMDFFRNWEIAYSTNAYRKDNLPSTAHDPYQRTDMINSPVERCHSLPILETWECATCSFKNKLTDINCDACFSPIENGKQNSAKNEKYASTPIISPQDWQCYSCTFINSISNITCDACMTSNVYTDRGGLGPADYDFGNEQENPDIQNIDLVPRSILTNTHEYKANLRNKLSGVSEEEDNTLTYSVASRINDREMYSSIENTCNSQIPKHNRNYGAIGSETDDSITNDTKEPSKDRSCRCDIL